MPSRQCRSRSFLSGAIRRVCGSLFGSSGRHGSDGVDQSNRKQMASNVYGYIVFKGGNAKLRSPVLMDFWPVWILGLMMSSYPSLAVSRSGSRIYMSSPDKMHVTVHRLRP